MVNFAGMEFIFYFFPVFLLIYHLIPIKYKDVVLLLGSYLFYASGDLKYVLLLLLLTLCNYFMGQQIHKLSEGYKMHSWQRTERKKKLAFIISLDVTVLLVFKMLAVFVDSSLFPLGLSFYLFKMISFQVDYYRGEIFEKTSFLSVAVYFSLFPQVISGPIMRYNEGTEPQNRIYCLSQLEDGMKYFAAGLGMKVLLADRLAILWNDLQMIGYQSISTPLAWLGAAGYSLQLYFDFWGYSLMASGILVCLGFDFIENFHHPYASGSIGEFYRRWHMTLGRFFRDYVYIPLGGNRVSKIKHIRNLLIVWFLTGLWHGAAWNFVAWGLYYGVILIIEKYLLSPVLDRLPDVVRHIYSIVLVVIGWVLFFSSSFGQAADYIRVMFGAGAHGFADRESMYLLTSNLILWLILIFGSTPLVHFRYEHMLRTKKWNTTIINSVVYVALFIVCIAYLVTETYNPFLYFRF